MPTTLPFRSTSGPPELPGLMAASVWIASKTAWLFWSPEVTGRATLLTMPEVTVSDSPSGAPTATTAWPTTRLADLPNVAAVTFFRPATLTTARSSDGSVPTTVALAVCPSLVTIEMLPPPDAMSTTWLLVRM